MKNFWDYLSNYNITKPYQLSLGEGSTPLVAINSTEFGLLNIKDEYANPNNSFKDRSLAYQLSYHIQNGKTRFVISSSGNAAISSAAYLANSDCELDIFVSTEVEPSKLTKLTQYASDKIRIQQSAKAKSDAIKFANTTGAFNLRGSLDPQARIGFKSIAYELAEQAPEIDAIFIPCSSGTSSLAIADGFRELGKKVAIHICQTTKIHPIAKEFDQDFVESKSSVAQAVSDRVAHQKTELVEAIKQSQGSGWVISDIELEKAKSDITNGFPDITYNSLLSVCGLHKAQINGYKYKNPLCLFSGL